jgi:ubiquinone/menaquinone biosynthesis C-methylase UbiE
MRTNHGNKKKFKSFHAESSLGVKGKVIFEQLNFQDHFSKQSNIYRQARPTYPEELFAFLASLTPAKKICWDCATGNGQAAVSLAQHFEKVIATDASEKQIQNAIQKQNIEYRVATAEQSNLPDNYADLITVATAAHWFNFENFYNEVQRVAKPQGILAVWTYSEASITNNIDELMRWFMYDYLNNYWPDGRWYVRNKYETLPFPFQKLETPDFYCRARWNKQQWLNYVMSWSSYNNYLQQNKTDALQKLLPELNLLWNNDEEKEVKWHLHLKCARLNAL